MPLEINELLDAIKQMSHEDWLAFEQAKFNAISSANSTQNNTEKINYEALEELSFLLDKHGLRIDVNELSSITEALEMWFDIHSITLAPLLGNKESIRKKCEDITNEILEYKGNKAAFAVNIFLALINEYSKQPIE